MHNVALKRRSDVEVPSYLNTDFQVILPVQRLAVHTLKLRAFLGYENSFIGP